MSGSPPSPASREPLRRDPEAGIVGGVIAGIAVRLKTDPVPLRIAFVVLTIITGGALLIAYALAWALIPTPDGATGISFARLARGGGRRWQLGLGVALLVLAALLIFRELGIWWSDAFVWPLVLLAGGIALLWAPSRSVPEPEGPPLAALRSTARGTDPGVDAAGRRRSSLVSLYRGGFGIALVGGAALLVLATNDALGPARDAIYTTVVAVLALGLILAPFIWRLGRNLAAERAARIRSQERAEVAAHLHDSVLQTLALVQRRVDDPREVAALARRQERELRAWLAGGGPGGDERGSFAAALAAAAEAVEDDRRVRIDVVAVGDCELDQGTEAVVAAAREAMTNAAKFAPEHAISLYAEVTPERVEAFVRDRGPGFDPQAVSGDRRGVRESIIGRMRRHGGDATITSVPGSGTEIALTLPRDGRAG